MLFNSFAFILVFLPITLLVFFGLGAKGQHRTALAWLVCASLVFYGWWNPAYLALLLGSTLFNFTIGCALSNRWETAELDPWRRAILIFGITGNLGALGYFKYANFFVTNINVTLGTTLHLETVILPLAISFFTFQQIAYLVDAYRGEAGEHDLLRYGLFVVFFPQLLAGPIVHHQEILPQFTKRSSMGLNATNLSVGVTIFSIGLFKKVIIADGMASYADPIFDAAARGTSLAFFEAWAGTLAYSLQIYFDFSGYTDMAIGLARMFGIRLPLNFNSPYKATSIIDFWHRWHMTLSRFLRDYLYIPLGGSRNGPARALFALMATMILGGLWHGAAWSFVLWGALHGVFLVVNHAWRFLLRRTYPTAIEANRLYYGLAWLTTFLAVVVAWVLFRAEDFESAVAMYQAMLGLNGISFPYQFANRLGDFELWIARIGIAADAEFAIHPRAWSTGVPMIFLVIVLVWSVPNTQELLENASPALKTCKDRVGESPGIRLRWQPNYAWAAVMSLVTTLGIFGLSRPQAFIYFQF